MALGREEKVTAYRVLIVDDSPAMRKWLRRALQTSGFDLAGCLEAGNGIEALAVLSTGPVDLILTDINMPVMDGVELVRQLKAEKSWRSIPVFVISTDSTEHRVQEMLVLGARGYISKPFLGDQLKTELGQCLGATRD